MGIRKTPSPSSRRLAQLAAALRPTSSSSAAQQQPPAAAASTLQLGVVKEFADGGSFGARITGVDLADLRPGELQELRAAYRQHKLLHIPNQQHLTPQREVSFYRAVVDHVDPAIQQWSTRAPIPGAEEISLVGYASLDDHHGISGQINPTGEAPQWHPVSAAAPFAS
eukprot:COSAG04_NODE_10156_length_800_cov_1.203994_1_plen_167_part_10